MRDVDQKHPATRRRPIEYRCRQSCGLGLDYTRDTLINDCDLERRNHICMIIDNYIRIANFNI